MIHRALASVFFLIISFATTAQVVAPFTLTPEGHILFDAEINGVKGKFIFDTGAGMNVVTKKYYDKLKNTTTDGRFFTAHRATGDRIDVQLYKATVLKVGTYEYKEPYFSFLDLDWGPIDGIISLKNFEQALITIDYTKNTLVINEKSAVPALRKQAAAILPIQLSDMHGVSLDILCFVKINDTQTGQFMLDSGAGNGVYKINARYMPALNIDPADTARVKKRVIKSPVVADHENTVYVTTVDKLAIASSTPRAITKVRGQFIDGLIYDGIMSTAWLGKKITISVPTKEIFLD